MQKYIPVNVSVMVSDSEQIQRDLIWWIYSMLKTYINRQLREEKLGWHSIALVLDDDKIAVELTPKSRPEEWAIKQCESVWEWAIYKACSMIKKDFQLSIDISKIEVLEAHLELIIIEDQIQPMLLADSSKKTNICNS